MPKYPNKQRLLLGLTLTVTGFCGCNLSGPSHKPESTAEFGFTDGVSDASAMPKIGLDSCFAFTVRMIKGKWIACQEGASSLPLADENPFLPNNTPNYLGCYMGNSINLPAPRINGSIHSGISAADCEGYVRDDGVMIAVFQRDHPHCSSGFTPAYCLVDRGKNRIGCKVLPLRIAKANVQM